MNVVLRFFFSALLSKKSDFTDYVDESLGTSLWKRHEMVKRVLETLVMASENGTSVVDKVPHLVNRTKNYAFAGISVSSFEIFAKSLIAALGHVLGSSVPFFLFRWFTKYC